MSPQGDREFESPPLRQEILGLSQPNPINTNPTYLPINPSPTYYQPDFAPDKISEEEECVGAFLGVRDNLEPTPMPIPTTTCRKTYVEKHLSFNYPCNWTITPMVEKEISPTCGFVRELYLLAGDTQAGFLKIYPENSIVGYDKNRNKIFNSNDLSLADFIKVEYSHYNPTSKCTIMRIGDYPGELCENIFYSKPEKTIISLEYRDSNYKKEVNEIFTTIKLDY